ncbi:MAG: epimerase [Mycobacterium sp.]|jgi:nucleoside-diphosphate-sugar epimerase|nr:epimerase [Mycobacterium sp.]
MRILVTGANGFLGREVVAVARSRGHQVRVLVRRPASTDDEVDVVIGDVREPADVAAGVAGCDVVIHLAALKQGDLHAQLQTNAVGTERLLEAMRKAGVPRFVLASSFTVYDCVPVRRGATITEQSPVVERGWLRDAYTATKLLQEELAVNETTAGHMNVAILRAGVVYGPENLWTARLGQELGPVRLTIGRRARVPLTHVHNCAHALVLAAESEQLGVTIYNVVDDDAPTQAQYYAAIRPGIRKVRRVHLPFYVAMFVARALDEINRRWLRGNLRIPNFVSHAALAARGRRFDFANAALKQAYGWRPIVGRAEGVRRALGRSDVRADQSVE